jgi:branched-chain amino acid transport system ATP-binding protein
MAFLHHAMQWGAEMSYSVSAERAHVRYGGEGAVELPSRTRSGSAGLDEARVTLADTTRIRPILALEKITLSFGGVAAIVDVDLAVAPGEIRAIIGPNGAGKSSLINVISGVYAPDRGRVRIGETTFRQVPANRLARLGVARTYQNLALFKGLSVLDNVAIGRVNVARSNFIEQALNIGRAPGELADAEGRAEEMIGFLGLRDVRHRSVDSLPYGLQKRVEFARALVAKPKILLLDEPMAGMTALEKRELAELIRRARDEFGTTAILIEHDIGVVMGLSDRVAVLDYGRKIADGTPEEVRADQAVIDAYLGVVHDDHEAGDDPLAQQPLHGGR